MVTLTWTSDIYNRQQLTSLKNRDVIMINLAEKTHILMLLTCINQGKNDVHITFILFENVLLPPMRSLLFLGYRK